MRLKTRIRSISWPTVLCLLAGAALADEHAGTDPLFESNDRLDVVIEAPWSTFMTRKPKDEDLEGVFRVIGADQSEQQLDVSIRARGHSRHDWCDFPPVLLNFKRSAVEDTLFANQNKLKLVVHCMTSAKYEQIVLKEYLVYRMLNIITDRSFNVRLLRVRYVDSEGRKNDIERYAFLLEHKNRLAERLSVEPLEVERAKVSAIDGEHLNMASVFSFMVGNTDFSPLIGPRGECCHNYVLFTNETDPYLAVPYDFDQSGVVDAPYAIPNQQFGIRSVKQRVYRGRCANNEYLDASIQRFKERREQIFEVIDQLEGLQDSTRRRARDYIEDFYEIIDNPRKVEREIIDECV
jgi:hypothetical protein